MNHPGVGTGLIDIKNEAGRSPHTVAELAGWDEGARWFVEVMNLETDSAQETALYDETFDKNQNIEVEIEDADGKVAKVSLVDSFKSLGAERSGGNRTE